MASFSPRPDSDRARLEALGYRVSYRIAGWVECLVQRRGERWLGHGSGEREALDDVLSQMLPSWAARATWRAGSVAGEHTPAHDAPQEPVEADAGSGAPGDATPTAPPEATPRPTPAPRPEPLPGPADPSGPADPPRRHAPMPVDEVRARLQDLSQEIDETQFELASWTPERQRLLLLRWIAAARAVEVAAEDERVAHDLVHGLALRLTSFAKALWPGSVPALQLTTLPYECARDVQRSARDAPRSWLEVEEAAESCLNELADVDEGRGRGELGWADEPCLAPAHRDPEGELNGLEHRLEELTGGQDESSVSEALRHPDPTQLEAWIEWARTARWIRGELEDTWRWGRVMGRLRWLAERATGTQGLQEVLDPAYRPPGTWAQHFGFDPDKRTRQRLRKKALRSVPAAEVEERALIEWLQRAFDTDLETERIAGLLAHLAERVAPLEASALESYDRKHRRRLVKLQALLAGEETEPDDSSDEEHEPRDEAREGSGTNLELRLLADVLPHTRGERALVVTNRADPELDRTLTETFEFADLDHLIGSPRRVQSAAERIQAGSYDLVLSATGFQSHKVDAILRKASRDAGVPYVSVNRGRRSACIRALARELGLLQRSAG